MDYKSYNCTCFMTSVIVTFVLLYKYKDIDLCFILILAALFSILWRLIKIYKGEKYIEKDNHKRNHLLFNCDFAFSTLALLCVILTGKINSKFLLLIITIFLFAWLLELNDYTNNSNIIHTYGHLTIIFIIVLTYYFKLN